MEDGAPPFKQVQQRGPDQASHKQNRAALDTADPWLALLHPPSVMTHFEVLCRLQLVEILVVASQPRVLSVGIAGASQNGAQ